MNLNQMLVTRRNVDQLSAQFGLSEVEAASALTALLPAFSEGLKRQVSSPQGAVGLIEALAGGGHAQYAQDPRTAMSEAGIQDGQAILGHLFGNKDVSRAVASNASAATGIGSSIFKSMLPVIASMVMGSLFKGSTRGGGGLGGMLGNALGGAGGSGGLGGMLGQAAGGGLLGTLIEGLAGGVLGSAKQPARRRAPTRRGGQASNSLEDLLGQVLGGGAAQQRRSPTPRSPMPRSRTTSRRAQRRQNPAGEGLGGLLGELLGGAPSGRQSRQGRYRDPVNPRAQQTKRRTQYRRQAPQQNRDGLEQIFGDMLEPGNQTSREYQRQTGSVFDELLGN